jgi:hypothetical protein
MVGEKGELSVELCTSNQTAPVCALKKFSIRFTPSHTGMRPCKHHQRPRHNPPHLRCPVAGCLRQFRSYSGRTKHVRSLHHQPPKLPPLRRSPTHPLNNADTGDTLFLNMNVSDLLNIAGDEGFQWRFSPSQALQAEGPPFSQELPSNNGSLPPADNTPLISWHHHPVLDGKFHPPHHI